MKLLDKLKDLFMDEVDVDDELEIEEEPAEEKRSAASKTVNVKKEENVLPKVMRDTILHEEQKNPAVTPTGRAEDNSKQQQEKPREFNFPIDFELDLPSRNKRNVLSEPVNEIKESPKKKEIEVNKETTVPVRNVNVLDFEKEAAKKVSNLYSNGKELIKEKPKFKATPVISPVYGILDKNYTKEEVKERNEEPTLMKRPSKKVDFETVRKKAFGNLADEIKDNLLCENCELYKEVKKISALKEDDLLYDMTVDEEEPVTIEKAYDNYEEFGVAYEPKRINNTELEKEEVKIDGVLDNILEDDTKLDDIISRTHDEEKIVDSDVSIQDSNDAKPVIQSEFSDKKEKDDKVDEDFFELIDSMYKERSEE